jgi:hypothetical protein
VVVQGRVRNVVSMAAPVPLIRVALVDKRGYKVKTEIVKLGHAWIAPNDTQSFRAVLPDPKAAASDVDVSFALDLAVAPKPLRPVAQPPAPAAAPRAQPALSQPAPILRPALPAQSAPAALTQSAPAAPAHASGGLRGLDSGGLRGVSPGQHG